MHRKSRQIRRRPLAVAAAILTALALVAGAISLSPATADTAMSPLELAHVQQANCQVLLAKASTSAARTRARQCIADQQVIIDALSGPSPTPSATQSASPSPSPTVQPSPSSSPTATTPPATTPPATTPPPTPSPTTTGLPAGCVDRLAQCGYPTPDTTGWATPPTVVFNGNLVIRTAGVYENLDVKGCVDVQVKGVTIRNSRIACQGDALITYNSPAHNDTVGNTVIERVEVSCVVGKGSGIYGHNFTAVGVWVHDCENGAEINAYSSITDSVLSAREATSAGHGDGIQSQGGDHVTIRHNTLLEVNPVTSAIITNPTLNNGWLIEDNFMGGGAYTLYCPEQGTDFVVRNNRFVQAKAGALYSAAYGLTDACDHPAITWSGNYVDSNLRTVSASGAIA